MTGQNRKAVLIGAIVCLFANTVVIALTAKYQWVAWTFAIVSVTLLLIGALRRN